MTIGPFGGRKGGGHRRVEEPGVNEDSGDTGARGKGVRARNRW